MSGVRVVHDFATRRTSVLREIAAVGVDVQLVSDLANIRYLTGFTGSNAVVVLASEAPTVLVTDGRYEHQARQECPDCEIMVDRSTIHRALQLAGEPPLSSGPRTRIGFEAEHMSVATWRSLADAPGSADLVATTGVVERVRRRKDPSEIQLIQAACQIAEAALVSIMAEIGPGRSERDIARELDFAMLLGGADDRAFETIVASGANSAVPHHRPTDRQVAVGDLLKIDFGTQLGGYHSDITRTFIVGDDPTDEQLRWHHAVSRAAETARGTLRPGIPASQPYLEARAILESEDLAAAFTHGLGHGVGLNIHEAPIMTATCEDTLEVDEVVTVEPGVYFPGFGGIRIEDTIVVTDTGSRCLTTLTRDLTRLA